MTAIFKESAVKEIRGILDKLIGTTKTQQKLKETYKT